MSEVQEVDTSLAMEVTAMAEQFGKVVTCNISPGLFIQISADNNDLKEETLDGKNTTHATTTVVYQRKQFGPDLPPTARADHKMRRRSLEAAYTLIPCTRSGNAASTAEDLYLLNTKGPFKRSGFQYKQRVVQRN